MTTVEFKKMRGSFVGEVGKAKKALDTAKANLERIGRKAQQEVARAKAEFDAAHAAHQSAAKIATEFDTFLKNAVSAIASTPTAPTAKGKAAAKTSTKAPVKAATKGKAPAKAKAAAKPAAKAAPVKAAAKGKTAKAAPKAKAKPTTAVKAATAPKREGTTLVGRLCAIIGTKTMGAGDIEKAILAQGNVPASKNLRGYISTVLSSTKDKSGKKIFAKEGRGMYFVPANRNGNGGTKAAPAKAAPAKAAPKKAATAAAPAAEPTPAATPEPAAEGRTPADNMMAELGLEGFSGTPDAQPLA